MGGRSLHGHVRMDMTCHYVSYDWSTLKHNNQWKDLIHNQFHFLSIKCMGMTLCHAHKFIWLFSVNHRCVLWPVLQHSIYELSSMISMDNASLLKCPWFTTHWNSTHDLPPSYKGSLLLHYIHKKKGVFQRAKIVNGILLRLFYKKVIVSW